MKTFQIKIKLIKRKSFENLATQRSSPMSMPSVGPTWNSHCDGITWKQSDSEKNSFVSFCASSSHFVIICFSFSFCVSLSRLVSICFIVSQFVILSQFILSLFQFVSVYLQPQHLCQRFWCPHRGRPCSELPRCLFRTPSLHSRFKRELI